VASSDVLGLTETLEALQDLPTSIGRGVLRRALVKAAEPVAEAARALAPDDPRTGPPDLKRSIEVSSSLTERAKRTAPKENEVEVYVGPARQAGRAVLNYAATVEFGTYQARPYPYMRPAWDRAQGSVMPILAQELTVEFERAAARLTKRLGKLSRQLSRIG
jgi:HK97 gp10 family phage protein